MVLVIGLIDRNAGDDTHLAQIVEVLREHIFGIDAVGKSGAASLDRAGDVDLGLSFVWFAALFRAIKRCLQAFDV